MVQPVQQPTQPLSKQASAPSMPVTGRIAATRPSAAGPVTAPRFSGLPPALTNKLLPVFQNISEVFIWAYLAQDIISMVIPRIVKGTVRGRETWEPSEDPNTRNLPFTQQARLWVMNNIKGLNWANGREQVVRESMSGPGLLAVLGIGTTLAGKLFGSSAMQLSVPTLEGLGQDFIARLQEAEQRGKTGANTRYGAVVRQHLDQLFVDPAFRKENKRFLQNWINHWAEAVETHADDAGARTRRLTELSGELEGKVWEFNRKHRVLPYAATDIPGLAQLDDKAKKKLGIDTAGKITRNLHRSDQVWVKMEGKVKQESIGELLKNLARFSDFSGRVYEKASTSGETLSKVARNMLERLVTRKFFTGAALTLIGGMYLIKVSKWSMSNESYQANRLLQLNQPAETSQTQRGGHPQ